MKPCSCGKFRHMCPSCKTAYFSDSNKTCDTIDWTKPIYATEFPVTAVSRTLPAKYHGKTFEGEAIVEIIGGHYCEPVPSNNITRGKTWIIENIPEPKPEKWINVYWNKKKGIIQGGGACFTSKTIAKSWGASDSSRTLLGTFNIQE